MSTHRGLGSRPGCELRIALALVGGSALAFGGFALASSGRAGKERVASALVRLARPSARTAHRFAHVLGPTRIASNAATFTDPSGDSGNAPDVTTITVSNDDAGNITITITLANRSDLQSQDLFAIGLDTDQNASTGKSGFDYQIGANSTGCFLLQWNGSFFLVISSPTLSCPKGGGVLTFHINRSDLGGTNGFNFAIAASGDNGATTGEVAPNSGVYSYTVVIGAATTTTATTAAPTTTAAPAPKFPPNKLVFVPKRPVAGKQFAVVLVPLRGGTVWHVVACKAKAAGKAVLGRAANPLDAEAISGRLEAVACVFKIPKAAKGKTIKGTITVKSEGATLSKPFSAKIT